VVIPTTDAMGWNNSRREARRGLVRNVEREFMLVNEDSQRTSARRRDVVVCACCGEKVPRRSHRQKFCSDECKEIARQRVRKAFFGPPIPVRPRKPRKREVFSMSCKADNRDQHSRYRWACGVPSSTSKFSVDADGSKSSAVTEFLASSPHSNRGRCGHELSSSQQNS
jgi:hypothetical protein